MYIHEGHYDLYFNMTWSSDFALYFEPYSYLAMEWKLSIQGTPAAKWAMSWENLFCHYVNNKGTDQRNPISAFVIHCLDSIISLVSICKISNL